jgi:hypothetical protein
MKKLILAILAFLMMGCAGPIINLSNVSPGMTKQDVIQLLGQPESVAMDKNEIILFFLVHDHAFGRDKNRYAFGFRDDKLLGFAPLPEDRQEPRDCGPVDAALGKCGNRIIVNQGDNLGITPNAYGPGIHMDQYGRPVQIVPK